MASLKPCPFCGDFSGLILKDKMVDCRYHEYNIYCEGCDTNGPIATKERTPEEAIQKWNRRAIFSGYDAIRDVYPLPKVFQSVTTSSEQLIAQDEWQKSPEPKITTDTCKINAIRPYDHSVVGKIVKPIGMQGHFVEVLFVGPKKFLAKDLLTGDEIAYWIEDVYGLIKGWEIAE